MSAQVVKDNKKKKKRGPHLHGTSFGMVIYPTPVRRPDNLLSLRVHPYPLGNKLIFLSSCESFEPWGGTNVLDQIKR